MRSSPGGCGNSGDEPNSACLEREAMAKDHGQDFSLVESGPRYVAILTASFSRPSCFSKPSKGTLCLSFPIPISLYMCVSVRNLERARTEARILGRI